MPRGQSFEQAQVLRRDTGYHSYRLGADMLRWSVFLSRPIGTLSGCVQRVAAERDNNTDVGP